MENKKHQKDRFPDVVLQNCITFNFVHVHRPKFGLGALPCKQALRMGFLLWNPPPSYSKAKNPYRELVCRLLEHLHRL